MTDALNEQLSALLDGEMAPAESSLCLKRLERSAELRATLGRYALIGEAMRSTEPVAAVSSQFVDRVSAALTVTEPVAEAASARAPVPGAVAGPTGWWRSAVGLGVAAAVGALAILLVGRGGPVAPAPQLAAQQPAPPSAPLVVRAATPSIGDLLPAASRVRVAGNGEPNSYVTPLPSRVAVPQRPASEFANYVVAHAEYASPLGRRTVLSGLVGAEPPAEVAAESLFGAPRVPQAGALPANNDTQ